MIFKDLEFNRDVALKTKSFSLDEEQIKKIKEAQNKYLLMKALYFNGKLNFLEDLISSKIEFDDFFYQDAKKRDVKKYSRVEVNYELKKIFYTLE